jgi:hypothetical protein
MEKKLTGALWAPSEEAFEREISLCYETTDRQFISHKRHTVKTYGDDTISSVDRLIIGAHFLFFNSIYAASALTTLGIEQDHESNVVVV